MICGKTIIAQKAGLLSICFNKEESKFFQENEIKLIL